MDSDAEPGQRPSGRHVRRPDAHRAALSTLLAHQLGGELPATDGRRGAALSASKEIEPGFRTAILLAENLFRLDVTIDGDSLRTAVRNLSAGDLTMDAANSGYSGASVVLGDVERYEPARSEISFALGAGRDRVEVRVTLGLLSFRERGTVRVTAQAIIRETSGAAGAQDTREPRASAA